MSILYMSFKGSRYKKWSFLCAHIQTSNSEFKLANSPHLHSDDGIDEEEHGNEQAHVRQSLPEKRERGIIQKSVYMLCLYRKVSGNC